MEDFRECIESCTLTDVGFAGPEFTWCNNQQGEARILACLDICLFCARNSDVNAKIRHLPRVASDHAPLLVDFYQNNRGVLNPLNFLMFGYRMLHAYLSLGGHGISLWMMVVIFLLDGF